MCSECRDTEDIRVNHSVPRDDVPQWDEGQTSALPLKVEDEAPPLLGQRLALAIVFGNALFLSELASMHGGTA